MQVLHILIHAKFLCHMTRTTELYLFLQSLLALLTRILSPATHLTVQYMDLCTYILVYKVLEMHRRHYATLKSRIFLLS